MNKWLHVSACEKMPSSDLYRWNMHKEALHAHVGLINNILIQLGLC